MSGQETVSVSFAFTQDSYAKGSNAWYKEFYGIVVDGVTYTPGKDGQFPEGTGLIYTKTVDPDNALKITAGKVAIDASVYTGKLTGIELLCRHSQYMTYAGNMTRSEICAETISPV